MSYLVVVTFDIKNGKPENYELVKTEFEVLGLKPELVGDSGTSALLPGNTFAAEISGNSASAIKDELSAKISALFKKHNLSARIFVSVGGSWAGSVRNA